MPATEPFFVERIHVLGPPGFQAAIRDAAHQEGRTASECIRQAIRDRLRRSDGQATHAVAVAPATEAVR